jgi:hypothetical protein
MKGIIPHDRRGTISDSLTPRSNLGLYGLKLENSASSALQFCFFWANLAPQSALARDSCALAY